MAYITGSANSLDDLLTALQAGLAANGWSADGAVVTKGGFAALIDVANIAQSAARHVLRVQAGNGHADGALSDGAPAAGALGALGNGDANGMSWPAVYHLHIHSDPDEVYLIVNYAVDYYQWIAFGASPVPGLPGTGNWHGGTFGAPTGATKTGTFNRYPGAIVIAATGGNGGNQDATSAALFWASSWVDTVDAGVKPVYGNCFHHGLDGGGWSMTLDAVQTRSPLLSDQPSVWNGQSILHRIEPWKSRPSNMISRVGSLAHARFIVLQNYAPEDIITLGSDQWKIYPWYRKGTTRDVSYGDNSGWLGWAVRYDGEA
jgi:hypothetical protein